RLSARPVALTGPTAAQAHSSCDCLLTASQRIGSPARPAEPETACSVATRQRKALSPQEQSLSQRAPVRSGPPIESWMHLLPPHPEAAPACSPELSIRESERVRVRLATYRFSCQSWPDCKPMVPPLALPRLGWLQRWLHRRACIPPHVEPRRLAETLALIVALPQYVRGQRETMTLPILREGPSGPAAWR